MASGDYILDQEENAVPDRLQNLLERWLDSMTQEHIDAIGIDNGWCCLEIGPGAGSMTRWLCDRVGSEGRVVALDLDTKFISEFRHEQLEIRETDIVGHELEESAGQPSESKGS